MFNGRTERSGRDFDCALFRLAGAVARTYTIPCHTHAGVESGNNSSVSRDKTGSSRESCVAWVVRARADFRLSRGVANAAPWYGPVAYLKQDFTGNLFQDCYQF